jgi:hypothetical protein
VTATNSSTGLCVAWVNTAAVDTLDLTREQVITAAQAHGIRAPGTMDFATTRSFIATAERLTRDFVDDFGRAWRVIGDPSQKRTDVAASASVWRVPLRPASGERLKLAELSCRKKSNRHPLELRSTLRSNLPAQERTAAKAWVKAFERSWTESELEPSIANVRRMVRAAMVDARAWPATRARQLSGLWFVHQECAGQVDAVLEFVAEVSPSIDGACMPVVATPTQVALAGELCDEFLSEQAQTLLRLVRKDVEGAREYRERVADPRRRKIGGRPRENRVSRYLEQVLELTDLCEFHEKRLSTELSTTRHWCRDVLDACEELHT